MEASAKSADRKGAFSALKATQWLGVHVSPFSLTRGRKQDKQADGALPASQNPAEPVSVPTANPAGGAEGRSARMRRSSMTATRISESSRQAGGGRAMLRFARVPFTRQRGQPQSTISKPTQTAWDAWSNEEGRPSSEVGIFRRLQSSVSIVRWKKSEGAEEEEEEVRGGDAASGTDAVAQLRARVVELEAKLHGAVRRAEAAEAASQRAGEEATALRGKVEQLRTALREADPNHPALGSL